MAYIRKRGAKWYYTIEIGSETRKRKEVPGGATHQEAEAAYARALVLLEVNGGYVEPTKKMVAEFFAEWLSDDVSINTHKNTVRSYRPIFENHIRPAIGDRKLRSIRPQMLQQLLSDVKHLSYQTGADAYARCHARYFNQWCGETFGAGYTFHSMRHTHATLLLESGEDLELVSKRLGHGSINTTEQTYSHVLDARKQKTRSLLDQVL